MWGAETGNSCDETYIIRTCTQQYSSSCINAKISEHVNYYAVWQDYGYGSYGWHWESLTNHILYFIWFGWSFYSPRFYANAEWPSQMAHAFTTWWKCIYSNISVTQPWFFFLPLLCSYISSSCIFFFHLFIVSLNDYSTNYNVIRGSWRMWRSMMCVLIDLYAFSLCETTKPQCGGKFRFSHCMSKGMCVRACGDDNDEDDDGGGRLLLYYFIIIVVRNDQLIFILYKMDKWVGRGWNEIYWSILFLFFFLFTLLLLGNTLSHVTHRALCRWISMHI